MQRTHFVVFIVQQRKSLLVLLHCVPVAPLHLDTPRCGEVYHLAHGSNRDMNVASVGHTTNLTSGSNKHAEHKRLQWTHDGADFEADCPASRAKPLLIASESGHLGASMVSIRRTFLYENTPLPSSTASNMTTSPSSLASIMLCARNVKNRQAFTVSQTHLRLCSSASAFSVVTSNDPTGGSSALRNSWSCWLVGTLPFRRSSRKLLKAVPA